MRTRKMNGYDIASFMSNINKLSKVGQSTYNKECGIKVTLRKLANPKVNKFGTGLNRPGYGTRKFDVTYFSTPAGRVRQSKKFIETYYTGKTQHEIRNYILPLEYYF